MNEKLNASPLNILHIMPQIHIGGAETQLCCLISNSPPDVQHEVLYYSDAYDDKGYALYDKNKIRYSRVPRNKKRPIKFLKDFSKEIKKREPDIVHCWLWSGNLWGRWAAILAGVKHIIVAYRSCQVAYPFVVKNLERFTKNRVHYLANSRAGANYVADKLGINPGRFDVIYNGIDVSRFDISCDRREVFAGLDIPDNVKIVTMVGTLKEAKDHPMLLKIAQRCKEKNLPVRFMIAGHGGREKELKKLAKQLDLQNFVYFLGLRRDIPQILSCSDIFCYTSLWEGFPNALMEAMAAGLPVLTTDFKGVRELVTDSATGKIVQLSNVEAAVNVLKFYFENPETANSYAEAAKKFVKENLAMPVMVECTTEYYKKILSGDVI